MLFDEALARAETMARTSGIDGLNVHVDEAMLAAGRRHRRRRQRAGSRPQRRNRIVALVVAIAAAVASCGGSDDGAGPPAGTEPRLGTSSSESSSTTPLDTGPPPVSPLSTPMLTDERTAGSPTTSDAGGWVDDVAVVCDHSSSEVAAISEGDGSAPQPDTRHRSMPFTGPTTFGAKSESRRPGIRDSRLAGERDGRVDTESRR